MLRSAASKIGWMARATTTVVGLVIMLALVLGIASTAFGANGGNFILGQLNKATAITQLAGNVSGGPALRVNNPNTAAGSRALQLGVAQGNPPLTVNANAGKATNLDADKLDGLDSSDLKPLTANILPGGSDYFSADVVSSSKLRTGVYLVTFDRDLYWDCQRVATLTDPNGGYLPVDSSNGVGGEVYTALPWRNGSPLKDSVAVFTRNSAGNMEDRGFQLVVFC
jgi:hypothetical protein